MFTKIGLRGVQFHGVSTLFVPRVAQGVNLLLHLNFQDSRDDATRAFPAEYTEGTWYSAAFSASQVPLGEGGGQVI